jgi:hypothetical protein
MASEMQTSHIQVARLIRRIAGTLDRELDCGECADLSPQFVDATLAGQDTVESWALIRQHLEQCPVCAQEFVTLRDCARMDEQGTWPTTSWLLDYVTRRVYDA